MHTNTIQKFIGFCIASLDCSMDVHKDSFDVLFIFLTFLWISIWITGITKEVNYSIGFLVDFLWVLFACLVIWPGVLVI